MNFRGVYTALITPFKSNGSLDEEGFSKLLKLQLDGGCHGIVVLGTTGEASTLTPEEKKKIIQMARNAIPPSIKLLVGTGSNCTKTTIEDTLQAEKEGADAALVIAPYCNKPTQEGLFLHYQAIAHASKLPLLVYNICSRTGVNIQTATLRKLALMPSIMGVKEASGTLQQMMEVIEMASVERPDFSILSGDDNLTLPLIALGGHGVISVLSNLVPEMIVELYQLSLAESWVQARELHYRLLPLFRGAFIETNPSPIKALMHFKGLPSGPCRLPLSGLTPESEKHLRHLYETFKFPLFAHF